MKRMVLVFLAAAFVFVQLTGVYAQQSGSGQIQEKQLQNSDTAGWLTVPGTEIDVPVVWNAESNNSYLRRNFDGKMDFEGWYFLDYRWQDGVSRNTVIYANSSDEDPNGSRFSQLKAYRDEQFAKEHPYITFSTEKGDQVWEVFAVSVVDSTVPYILPDIDDSTIAEMRQQSLHMFDHVSVTAQDRILTLSTMDFSVTDSLPNNNRFVVMARLVEGVTMEADVPNTGK